MAWFKRIDKGIQTPTEAKKDIPKGLWYKTPSGKIIDTEELKRNLYVSPEDGYHVRIGSKEYFELMFDDNKFLELNPKITSKDPLKFEDTKKYSDNKKCWAPNDKTTNLSNIPQLKSIYAEELEKRNILENFVCNCEIVLNQCLRNNVIP